jgi:hypothetical protein
MIWRQRNYYFRNRTCVLHERVCSQRFSKRSIVMSKGNKVRKKEVKKPKKDKKKEAKK